MTSTSAVETKAAKLTALASWEKANPAIVARIARVADRALEPLCQAVPSACIPGVHQATVHD